MKFSIWVVVFLIAFALQLVLEQLNLADSIGVWYTVYCAAIDTAILFVVYVVARFVIARVKAPPK